MPQASNAASTSKFGDSTGFTPRAARMSSTDRAIIGLGVNLSGMDTDNFDSWRSSWCNLSTQNTDNFDFWRSSWCNLSTQNTDNFDFWRSSWCNLSTQNTDNFDFWKSSWCILSTQNLSSGGPVHPSDRTVVHHLPANIISARSPVQRIWLHANHGLHFTIGKHFNGHLQGRAKSSMHFSVLLQALLTCIPVSLGLWKSNRSDCTHWCNAWATSF